MVPAVAIVVSLIGHARRDVPAGFSLNNLSLMALTVATGFVVDDAIVVLENIVRHIEDGMPRLDAALQGAKEVGFTVVSISISLVAVFIPLLFMGGIVGRLFREFAMTLSASVLISLVISLTTTPMIAALLLRRRPTNPAGSRARSNGVRADDPRLCARARLVARPSRAGPADPRRDDRHQRLSLGRDPQGLFPEQDTGRSRAASGPTSARRSAAREKAQTLTTIVTHDPAIATVVGFTGGGGTAGAGSSLRRSSPRASARVRPRTWSRGCGPS